MNLPQDWSLCTLPPRAPCLSRDTRGDRDTCRVWGSAPGPGTRASRATRAASWLLITGRLHKTHWSDLTCQSLVTRLQLVPGHFYQLSSVDLITVCPCPCVIMTCFPGRDVVGEGTQAALATGPGAGLWSSHQPPPPPTSQTHNSQF